MSREVVLDTHALRAEADGSPLIERQLVLLYIRMAEQCLRQIQALVVSGDRTQWLAVTQRLRLASAKIHAGELTRLCADASDRAYDAASRLRVYTAIREAHERLMGHLKQGDLLERASGDT